MKRKAKGGATRNDGQAKIGALIDQFFGDDGSEDAWTREPLPDWFINVAMRFARIFAPQFSAEDLRHRKERFYGFLVAFIEGVISQVETAPKKARAKTAFGKVLNQLVAEVAKEGPQIVDAALAAARSLKSEKRSEFYAAHAEGLTRGIAVEGTQRLKDTSTAKMCFFLLMVRPWIDAQKVKSVTEMFEGYCKIHAAFGKPAAPSPEALASVKIQFSTLCSECGVRIRGKGQPKK